MLLVQLVYASRTNDEMTPDDIRGILAAAQANNARTGVTGALFYNSGFFLQCLEGSRQAVNNVYARILGDSRHREPLLLRYREVDERDFADWSMGYVGEGILNRDVFQRFGPTDSFDPFAMTGGSAHRLLLELARNN